MNSPEFNSIPRPEVMPSDRKTIEAGIEAIDNELQALHKIIKGGIPNPAQQERIESLFTKLDQLNQQLDRLEKPAANEPTIETKKTA